MPHDFMPGLAGVPAATSSISDVDGQRGILEYRGIRVETSVRGVIVFGNRLSPPVRASSLSG